MNGKNIFFGLCASMIIGSEISAMQLVAKRVPKSMHRVNNVSPMVQKRDVSDFFAATVWTVGGIMAINFIQGALDACPITERIITAHRLHNEVAAIDSEKCSNTYIKKEVCKNPQCCKYLHPLFAYEKRPELFCDINQGRDFLVGVRDGLQKLHSKEEEAKQLLAQDKIYIEGYQKIMGLLEHKKDCYVKQMALFEEFYDSDEAKKQREKEYCEKIKTITFMRTKSQTYDNQQQYNQPQYMPQQHMLQQQDKVDDSRRGDDFARDLNMLMMHAYVAKQICDSATAHSDSSSSASYTSNTESYSSQSYSDSSSSDSYSNRE